MRFRLKAGDVEAHQLPVDAGDISKDQVSFFGGLFLTSIFMKDGCLLVGTPNGVVKASPGDWIIRDANGSYFKCEADVFENTYGPVIDTQEGMK